MQILIIGSGGREHALTWKISHDSRVDRLYCLPGNPGMAKLAECISLNIDDISGIVEFATLKKIDLVIVGPEYPLSLGLADALRNAHIATFGPGKDGALLESSKSFSKEVMRAAGVPTPKSIFVKTPEAAIVHGKEVGFPVVLKADGLAAGKGVVICHTDKDLSDGVAYLFNQLHADIVLVEEFVKGVEASYIVATNGEDIIPLVASHDYKRVGDGNQGPNTGGMGAISPTPYLSEQQAEYARDNIIAPMLRELRSRNINYRGFLYAGLIVPEGQMPQVIEFNARLGDPETQVILTRLDSSLLDIIIPLASGQKVTSPVVWSSNASVCVVVASEGYPNTASALVTGDIVGGLEEAESVKDVIVFHAGTKWRDDTLVTSGGRVLSIIAQGKQVSDALKSVYSACEKLNIRGAFYRRDIGAVNG